MKRTEIILALLPLLLACKEDKKGSSLPFYNRPDFTPEWIAPGDSAYANIHRIAPFSFRNQDSIVIGNEQVKGRICVVNFFFTTCGSVCPRMMRNLRKVDSSFADDGRIRILSHTVLPQSDSVPRLRDYAHKRGIDSRRWWLLTGSKDEIYHLARTSYFADDSLGYGAGNTDFIHTENCVLVDGEGRLRGVYNATLELEMDQLIGHIRQLLREQDERSSDQSTTSFPFRYSGRMLARSGVRQ